MKRILFVGHDASLTGAPKSLLNIAIIFKKSGYKIEFILGRGGPLLKKYQEIGKVNVWIQNNENFNLFQKLLFWIKGHHTGYHSRLIRELKKKNPGLIFNNTIVNGSILEKLKNVKAPVITRIPEMESVIQMFNLNGESDKVLGFSNHFIAVSSAVKENLIINHSIPPGKVEVVYGFVPEIDVAFQNERAKTISKELNLSEKDFIIGGCGNLIFRKGFDLFIELAEKFKKEGLSNFKFVWVGGNLKTGTFFEIEQELRKRELTGIIYFVGEKQNPYPYYSLFDVFFLSSREDPFPLVMLEAAQFGLPIVGFRKSGGVEEFLEQGGGFLADYGDTDQVLDFVLKIRSDKDLYEKCSVEVKQALKRFDPEESKKKLLALIESMIS